MGYFVSIYGGCEVMGFGNMSKLMVFDGIEIGIGNVS